MDVDAMSSLNVASPDCAEAFFAGREPRCVDVHHASSLAELRAVLERHLDDAASPRKLDLIGHSTRDHHLLRLGSTPIDMLNPVVSRFFDAIVHDGLLPRLQVGAVRLLGCETAITEAGQRTLRRATPRQADSIPSSPTSWSRRLPSARDKELS